MHEFHPFHKKPMLHFLFSLQRLMILNESSTVNYLPFKQKPHPAPICTDMHPPPFIVTTVLYIPNTPIPSMRICIYVPDLPDPANSGAHFIWTLGLLVRRAKSHLIILFLD